MPKLIEPPPAFARLLVCLASLAAANVQAHHSDAGIRMDGVVTVEGTVTAYNWRNPHVYFMVEAPDERGNPVEWSVQMGSTITVSRTGWSRTSLAPGDHVVVELHPAANGRPYGIMESVERDGVPLEMSFRGISSEPALPQPDGKVRADSLDGIWLADRSKLEMFTGGFDGYFEANLVLTPKAVAAKAAYDPLSDENPEASCVGRPTPAMIVNSQLYPLQIELDEANDIVFIRTEFWDEERTVFMDGRDHPDASERMPSGHSIGHWEGDTLVVDTRNFADHRSPYQIGVPSGGQKHVVERYRLIDEGRRMQVDFMLEDPEYLMEPLTHSRELVYAPNMQFSTFGCDPETARRFLMQ